MEHLLKWAQQGTTSPNSFSLLLLFLFLSTLVILKFKRNRTTMYNFPPSPSKLPFIGNMHQLLQGSPHRTFHSLSQKHGPLMLLHHFSKPILVVSSANMAQAVLKTNDHVFSSRPPLAFVKRSAYGNNISFSPYGEHWRQVRKICVSELLSAKKVQSFRAIREEEMALLMDKLDRESQAVNLSKEFASLVNNIVCRTVLGRKYGEEEAGGRKFKKMISENMHLSGVFNIEDFVPSLGWINCVNGLNARVEKNFRELDTFFDEVIEEHIEARKTRRGGEEDLVDIILRNEEDSSLGIPVTRDTCKAIILDMFIAGTDTSAVVMEWAMSELIKHQEIMVEAQKEVRNFAKGKRVLNETDIKEMHIVKLIIKETLRLHPPAPLLVPHELIEDVNIEGYHIPAKTTVMVNAFAIARDPMWWIEPEKFWPRRFLNDINASIDFKGQHFQLIPFGAGRRGCPGIVFATSILELVIANLLNRFDWIVPNGLDGNALDMDEVFGVAVSRKTNLLLIAKSY